MMPAAGGQSQELLHGFDAAAYPVWSATGDRIVFLGRKSGEIAGDWWIVELRDRNNPHPTGLLAKLRKDSRKAPARAYFPVPAVWLPDTTILFAARNRDSTNTWAVRVSPQGAVLDEPHHWTDGTEVEDYPDAASSPRSIHAVYAALRMSTAIWRIHLSPDGKPSGAQERLLGGLTGLGSTSLSLDGSRLLFVTSEPTGNSINLADLGARGPGPASQVYLSNGIARSLLSGDGQTVAWKDRDKGYLMGVKAGEPEEVCTGCGLPSYVTFDGKKAIFEGGGSSEELLLCSRGEKARILLPISENHWGQAAGRFSPDERWLVFSGHHQGETARQILVVPVTANGVVKEKDVVTISAGSWSNREPVWSPDGRRIYFLSDRDGSTCIWARNMDLAAGRPNGPEYVVSHFDHAGLTIHGPNPSPATIGLSASKSFLVLTLTETTGNIWARQLWP